MEITERLVSIRNEHGYSKRTVSEMTGIPYTTYIKYESGERKDLSMAALCKLADFYGVTTDYLLGREAPPEDPKRQRYTMEITQVNDDNFVEMYEQLPDDFKQIFLDVMLKLSRAAAEKKQPAEVLITLPFYDLIPVSAGTGLYDDGNSHPEDRAFLEDAATRHADYCCRVSGDSMEPMFYSGDIVAVKQQEEVETGEIGVFSVRCEMFIKKLGSDCLISLNPKYDPIPLTPDVICQGRVLGKAITKA